MLKVSRALAAALSVTSFALSITASQVRAAQTVSGNLSVTAAFAPNPPSTKANDEIIVSVKDAQGAPVRGASVRIATSMPTMSMKGADIVAHDRGDGTYTADTKLAYATKWAFEITAKAKGRHGTTHVERILK